MSSINSTTCNNQPQTAEDQFFALLPFGRLMIEMGITPEPEFGRLEFDATALFFAHTSGRTVLPHRLLHQVIRISRGEERHPNRAIRREISARAKTLYRQSPLVSSLPPESPPVDDEG
jgi:hypothetical protein